MPVTTSAYGTFQTVARDIHEWGAWGQAGYNFTKELSLWGFAGTDHPSDKNLLAINGNGATFKTRNVTTAGMLQYRDGGYALGVNAVIYAMTH